TSGAYIPGHGTPTVILLGRNRTPLGDTTRAVLGIRGEPARPEEPAEGHVWSSITDLVDKPASENDYVTVIDLDRVHLTTHPWSLQGGGAVELRRLVEADRRPLASHIDAISTIAITREDDAYFGMPRSWARRSVPERFTIPMATGEVLRDWRVAPRIECLFPYDDELNATLEPNAKRLLWPCKQYLLRRKELGGLQTDVGLTWFEWNRFLKHRFREPLGIAFAFVATHNHFVLDRGGKVFKQTAPVIKLPQGASEDDHLALLGLLNSSTDCFWMQQVFHNKGGPGGAHSKDEKWHDFYEFDGTKLKQFPIPNGSALEWARRLDGLAQELSAT